ncbi:hypothetical protein EZV62_013417 [Acer yangbiense]|uniref:Endonuclease/exonuclease/phosphatase domain-containing protein n=1 Tax=Acer yangbiense TaxID=1000413 RepID=A0A5C7HZA3_9ROSI|nr:hypothetical protein EZV62_013417 [Acer yangbiense]
MSILCWNVQGLGNLRAFQALKRVLKSSSPNVVFLSKTKLHKGEADRFRHLLGFEGVLQVESEGNSFYGSPNQVNRSCSWELLKRIKRVDGFVVVGTLTRSSMLRRRWEARIGKFWGWKMCGCARKLGEWSRERFGSLGKLINSKREVLERLLGRAREEGISKETEKRCFKDVESVAYAVWWCDKADLVWAKTVFWGQLRRFKRMGCYETLRGMALCLKKEDLEELCMVLWGIWVDRNDNLHSLRCRPAESLVDWVTGLLKEFQESRTALNPVLCIVKAPSV